MGAGRWSRARQGRGARPRIAAAISATAIGGSALAFGLAAASAVAAECTTTDYDSTFEAIQGEIFDNPAFGCSAGGCHSGAFPSASMSLESGAAYSQIVGVPSVFNATLDRIEPGDASQSFLYLKVEAGTLGGTPPGGNAMPLGGFSDLPPEHLQALQLWIDANAPETGVVPGTADLLATCLEVDPGVDPGNAGTLRLAWEFPLGAGVTAPIVATDTSVYASAWDGHLYAIDPLTGQEQWRFDTGSGLAIGIQGAPTRLDDGRLLVADSLANVHLLDATGNGIWSRSVGNPSVDHVWSSVRVANGRVFVGVASHSDTPCTRGRTVALDLASGNVLWTRYNVPERVCSNDTGTACTTSAECGGAACVDGQGAGVTATPNVDETGAFVYVNTVGCYTYPSIGDSDAIMKLDASTGDTEWLTRVDPPEQFGSCELDPAVECGSDLDCAPSNGLCQTKGFYHDFGFLNGPLLIDVPDGLGGTQRLVVSGSKNGTLYALDETDGSIVWTNEVLPTPITPAFAGFGLFNGPVTYDDGRLFAGLNEFVPAVTPAPDHVMAFDATDGSLLWSRDFGATWSGASVQNGVVYVGNSQAGQLHTFDAATGDPLGVYPLPAPTTSLAAVRGDALYVGYGIFGSVGGVRAYQPAGVPSLGAVALGVVGWLIGGLGYWRLRVRR